MVCLDQRLLSRPKLSVSEKRVSCFHSYYFLFLFTQHLRLLRHPNILKYIGSEVSMDAITMVTEPVFPVLYVLSDASLECVVMGWRGLANGLTFLHTKAGLSHNNLSLMCVYASTGNSQWKVGGLELAIKHSRIDHKVRSLAADIIGQYLLFFHFDH